MLRDSVLLYARKTGGMSVRNVCTFSNQAVSTPR